MKWETIREGVSSGKAITVFEATSMPDALRTAAKMLEHPSVHLEPPRSGVEERITVAPVVPIFST